MKTNLCVMAALCLGVGLVDAAQSPRDQPSDEQIRTRLLNTFDRDRDGQLNLQEQQAATKRLRGILSGDALQSRLEQIQELGAPAPGDSAARRPQQAPAIPGVAVPEDMAAVQVAEVTGQDGNSVEIVLRIPPGDGPFPAVILLHGGMSYVPVNRRAQQSKTGPLATRLLASGYVVVIASYRTYADRSRDPGPIQDCVAVVDHIRKLAKVDAQSVVVFGHSGGGRLALELAGLKNRAGLAAIACGEPATTLYAEMYPEGMRGPNMEVSRNHQKYFTNQQREILRRKVGRLSGPILIAYSDQHVVNQVNNTYLLPELKALRKDVTTKLYPGYGHGFVWGRSGVSKEVFEKFVRDLKEFFGRHIETPPV